MIVEENEVVVMYEFADGSTDERVLYTGTTANCRRFLAAMARRAAAGRGLKHGLDPPPVLAFLMTRAVTRA